MITTEVVTKFINSYFKVAFSWGSCDCTTFIIDYLKTVTGINYDYLIVFIWKNKREAVRYATKNRLSVCSVLADNIPHTVISSISLAKVGDLVFINQSGWPTAGVLFNVGRVAFFTEHHGAKLYDISDQVIDKIIRVG